MSAKQVEKLEIQVHELTIRIEELNRTIVDITSIKTKISQVDEQSPTIWKLIQNTCNWTVMRTPYCSLS